MYFRNVSFSNFLWTNKTSSSMEKLDILVIWNYKKCHCFLSSQINIIAQKGCVGVRWSKLKQFQKMSTDLSWETKRTVIKYKWLPIQAQSVIRKQKDTLTQGKRRMQREKEKQRAESFCHFFVILCQWEKKLINWDCS